MRILITGACGWTAAPIIRALDEAGHEILGFDVPAAAPVPEVERRLSAFFRGNLGDYGAVEMAMRRADAVLHRTVAGGPFQPRTPRVAFSVKVAGTYNVFECARRGGVARLVLLSHAPVQLPPVPGAAERGEPGEDHLHELALRLQEEIARDFCERFEMGTIALRAGYVVDGRREVDRHGQPLAGLRYRRGDWICRHDLARACRAALDRGPNGFRSYHLVGSRTGRSTSAAAAAETELGFRYERDFAGYD